MARARQGVSAKRGFEIREGIRDRTPERIESVYDLANRKRRKKMTAPGTACLKRKVEKLAIRVGGQSRTESPSQNAL